MRSAGLPVIPESEAAVVAPDPTLHALQHLMQRCSLRLDPRQLRSHGRALPLHLHMPAIKRPWFAGAGVGRLVCGPRLDHALARQVAKDGFAKLQSGNAAFGALKHVSRYKVIESTYAAARRHSSCSYCARVSLATPVLWGVANGRDEQEVACEFVGCDLAIAFSPVVDLRIARDSQNRICNLQTIR